MLTDKEKKVLEICIKGSNFNDCIIDLNKSYKEQHWEGSEYYETFADANKFGFSNRKEFSGICSSLHKKGLIFCNDDGYGNDVITVGKKEFENLKKEFNK